MPADVPLQKWKKSQLQEELRKRGLATSGIKNVLIDRLTKAMESEASEAPAGDEPTAEVEAEVVAEAEAEAEVQAEVVPEKSVDAKVEPQKSEDAEIKPANGSTKPVTAATTGLTEEEKRKKRAERFGVSTTESEIEKRRKRAARFGLPVTASTSKKAKTSEEEKKRAARAARFGMSGAAISDDERKRREARMKRFGITAAVGGKGKSNGKSAPIGALKSARGGGKKNTAGATSISSDEQAKRKARAARFAKK
eukprot:CAMPEP_0114488352 /NCGR_PEP_ID=MMETSP0109-20121206/1280_1 /TAXON_ID=29199 /ORGANISM="Chlorarachnion reptans, Strain CCCM449" /LENGTH=252 /DNA_ID=CAMNT_0001664731 /DNA_START=732 /DNA_END=1490 /DNA_ORIENTATION=+